MSIKSAYNFAPLNKEIYLPSWGPLVSQDYPFENGLEGTIHLTITAKKPIYVRNGAYDKENTSTFEFSNFQGKHFIPGSSIKGMLRAVMEILTLGRLSQFNDKYYSYRDFDTKKEYGTNFINGFSHTTEIGWLIKEADNLKIYHSGRVKDNEILYKEIPIGDHYLDFYIGKGKKEDKKKSFDFYRLFTKNTEYPFQDEKLKYYGQWLIMTGQTGSGGKSAKKKQYLAKPFEKCTKSLILDQEIWQTFLVAVHHGLHDENEEWSFWKEFLNDGKAIPVFYNVKDSSILHFGITRTYRLPFKKGISQVIANTQYPKKSPLDHLDMPSVIFGYVTQGEENALKGRVHISPAFATKSVEKMSKATKVLAGPKSSFYNYYLEQEVNPDGKIRNNSPKTWNTGGVEIAGRKRYPIHLEDNTAILGNGNSDTKELETQFIPLDKGATFETTIRYHNLLPEELGALISAITFHHHDNCRHSIGMGKPLGFGEVSITIDPELSRVGEKKLNKQLQTEYLNSMHAAIDAQLKPVRWAENKGIKELIIMATPHELKPAVSLNYPDGSLENNEFPGIKKGKGLPRFSDLVQNKMEPVFPELERLIVKEYQKEFFELVETMLEKEIEHTDMLIKRMTQLSKKPRKERAYLIPDNQNKNTLELGKKIPDGVKNAKSFKTLDKQTSVWLVQLRQRFIPSGCEADFKTILTNLWQHTKDNKHKLKDWKKKNAPQRIAQWLGEDYSKAFFLKHKIQDHE